MSKVRECDGLCKTNKEFERDFRLDILTTEQALSMIAHSLNSIANCYAGSLGTNGNLDERNGIMVGIEKNIGEIASAIRDFKEEK